LEFLSKKWGGKKVGSGEGVGQGLKTYPKAIGTKVPFTKHHRGGGIHTGTKIAFPELEKKKTTRVDEKSPGNWGKDQSTGRG